MRAFLALLSGCAFGLGESRQTGECQPAIENCCTGAFSSVEVVDDQLSVLAEIDCGEEVVSQWNLSLDGVTVGSGPGSGPTASLDLDLDLGAFTLESGSHRLSLWAMPDTGVGSAELAVALFDYGSPPEPTDTGEASPVDSGDSVDTIEPPEGSVDLGVVSVGLVPSHAAPGEIVSVYLTVTNEGDLASEAIDATIYWSADGVWDASDPVVGSLDVGIVDPAALAGSYTDVVVGAVSDATVFVRLDAADADPSDDEGSASFVIDVIDLVVEPPQPDVDVVAAGGSFGVAWRLANEGSVDGSDSFDAGLYWSADASWDAADEPLATWVQPALAVGEVAEGRAELALPAGVLADGQLLLVADPEGLAVEADRSDNSAAVAVAVSDVDLELALDGLSAEELQHGDVLEVQLEVSNSGSGTAGAFSVEAWLSADASFDGADVALGTLSWVGLAGGAADAGLLSGIVPDASPNGEVYLLLVADGGGAVTETDEGDNLLALPLSVEGPDLVADLNGLSANNVAAGDVIEVEGRVQNWTAGATVAGVEAGLYLSADGSWDAGDLALGSLSFSALSAWDLGSTASVSVSIPVSTASGAWSILLVADPAGLVSESDESNNLDTSAITVR